MLIDARRVAPGTVVEADLCVVGAGAAGIVICREFAGSETRVCLLESGGLRFDARDHALNAGENVGLPYEVDNTRRRYFGGSTNAWDGWCKPMSELDMEARAWVPDSGWPFGRPELDAYYARAHRLCQLGPVEYRVEYWRQRLGTRGLGVLPLSPARVVTGLFQFSPPTRFGRAYRQEIARAHNVHAYLFANAMEVQTDWTGQVVSGLCVGTLSGARFVVKARVFVLAAGGIENARLLLVSRASHPQGIGNGQDLVGRYFMEHPRFRAGPVIVRDPIRADLYDRRRNRRSRRLAADGTWIAGYLGLADRVQVEEGLLGYRGMLVSTFAGEASDAVAVVKHYVKRAIGLRRPRPRRNAVQDARVVLAGLDDVARAAVGWAFKLRRLVCCYTLDSVVEPAPIRDSRVTLATDRDPLGVNRVRVEWRLGPGVTRTLGRVHAILDEELQAAGVGQIRSSDAATMGGADIGWSWHHMGTTRMHRDPRRGVVDPDCRVHGVANLFVAGSSVFPTAGSDAPTLTIVALALRLADRLRGLLDRRPAVISARGEDASPVWRPADYSREDRSGHHRSSGPVSVSSQTWPRTRFTSAMSGCFAGSRSAGRTVTSPCGSTPIR